MLGSSILRSLANVLLNNPLVVNAEASGMIFGLPRALVLIGARVGVECRGIIGIALINLMLGFILRGFN